MPEEDYELCPWCGCSGWHKTSACEDTCCSGCWEHDCQRTQSQIRRRNQGVWCYRVIDKDDCAEHEASFPEGSDRCEAWDRGPASWRFKDGNLVHAG